ncbi:MAG: RrF2 family transcriptional regulator [Bdellovibrionia bacterium]
MTKLNRKIEYALMALKYMSQKIPGELTTAKEVSESFQTPFDATARVMQIMASKGLLRVEHGAMGGYQITRDLSKVSMHELYELLEGPTGIVKCIQKEEPCEIYETCNIVSPLTALNRRLIEFYKGISLKELLLETKSPVTRLSEATHG